MPIKAATDGISPRKMNPKIATNIGADLITGYVNDTSPSS
jgi:hypothetical protein